VAADIGATPLVVDYADLDDVRRAAEEIEQRCPRLDVLINNAGGQWPRTPRTADGLQLSLQVNHVAPALLTGRLLPLLRASASPEQPARVIATSSALARRAPSRRLPDMFSDDRAPSGMQAYRLGKLANIYYTRELDRREHDHHVLALSYHPGGVATRLGRNSPLLGRFLNGPASRIMRTPEQGADTLVWLATAPAAALTPGGHYADRALSPVGQAGSDPTWASWLWDRTAEALA